MNTTTTPSPEALPAVQEGEYPPLPTRRMRNLDEEFEDLTPMTFTAEEMRAYVDSDRASRAQAAPAAASGVVAELERLRALINTPHTDDWMQATNLEAAHQQERWGTDHDIGKSPMDWFWLVGYLSGKALASFLAGNRDKGLHHIISTSAALLNWHRAATGEMTAMQPGHAPSVALDAALQSSQPNKG